MKITRNTRLSKCIALLIGLCLLVGMTPAAVFAEETDLFIFGYKSSAQIIGVSTTNQSDYTEIADYDDSLLGLEIINGTIYGLSCDHSFFTSKLVILNPDFTVQNAVGSWFNFNFTITDTAVQNGTLWGTYNDENADSYLIPISLTTGQPETAEAKMITGLPENEIVYTIACNAAGQMYAIVADGGKTGGAATLYTIDTSNGAAAKVGSTGVTTNFISSSAFAPDDTLYWAENKDSKLYKVNTSSGRATAVPGGTIGGRGFVLNAMMIPSDADTTAYVNFVVNGEGTVTMNGEAVSGWQKVTPGSNLALTFSPGDNSNVREVVVDGKKMGSINSYTLENVKAWSAGTHTVEVTFGSKDIELTANPWSTVYMGAYTLEYDPSFEATLYFTVKNGPLRHTVGVSNYEISIEKDGVPIDKKDLVPDTYNIRVKRDADENWNALDVVLGNDLIISKQTALIQWSNLKLTAYPGQTLADINKPTYLVSSLDGKQIPGTFHWMDEESTSVGNLGGTTEFRFRFVPNMPLSEELADLYDFSKMPVNGFDGTESNSPYTANVTVVERNTITLPVRTIESEDSDYTIRPNLTAYFIPDKDTTVTVGNFSEYQGLRIDYYNPMNPTEGEPALSEGYDMLAEYHVAIPLTEYEGETLSGTLTIPLPQGYDGATARIKGGASASSYTATTVTFPLTLDVSGNTAEAFELLIEYKKKSGTHSSPSPSSPDPLGCRLPYASEAEEPSASSGFESDTTSDFTVDGAYQFRITSLDGTAPVMTASNASFRVELASREGNDYFFKIYAQGAAGSTAEISVNGNPLLTATVGGSVSGVNSDTTHPFTVAQGGTYQFRLTASERPAFAAGSPSFTVEYAGRIGSDYFYKVRAIGKPGDGCGFYINRESAPVAVATIA